MTADGAGAHAGHGDATGKVELLRQRLPASLDSIPRLAEAVDAALDDRPDLAFAANLCFEELLTNIITHGLAQAPGHFVDVAMSLSPDWLEIVIRDDAPRFDPFADAPPPDLGQDIEHRRIGGLGVHLVKSLMDDARAWHDGQGNLILLLKNARPKGTA